MKRRVGDVRVKLEVEFDDPFDAAILVRDIEEHSQHLRTQGLEPYLHEYDRVAMADSVRVLDAVAAQLSAQILTNAVMKARIRMP